MPARLSREFRVAVFDLDGTLTDTQSVWQHLHEKFGTSDVGRKTADMYHNGLIDYEQWAKLDAMCWKDVQLSSVLSALNDVHYTPGAKETIEQLRNHGVRTAIVSAGLSVLTDKAKQDLNADLAIANELEVKGGVLTGEVIVRVGPGDKESVIEEAVWLLGAEMPETVVVGDNIFDIPESAGLRIAFRPVTPQARSRADIVVEDEDITAILDHIFQ